MRIWALIKRIIRQMLRDKRTLALLFVAPLLILSLMYFLFNGNDVAPKLGVVHVDQKLTHALEDTGIQIQFYDHADEDTVVNDKLDGLLDGSDGDFKLIVLNDEPSTAKGLQVKVHQAVAAQFQEKLAQKANLSKDMMENNVETKYVYGDRDTNSFD